MAIGVLGNGRYNGLHDIIRIMTMSKHESKMLSYVSMEMAVGYQQIIGVKPEAPIWFVCIEGGYGICNFSDINFSDIDTVFIFNLGINGILNLKYLLIACRGRFINYFILRSKQVSYSLIPSDSIYFSCPWSTRSADVFARTFKMFEELRFAGTKATVYRQRTFK